jgi:phage recombination protein Bet
MSKEVAISKAPQGVISAEQIKTLEQAGIIPIGTPEAQIKVYAEICSMHQLSPFAGEVHLVKYRGKEGDKYSVIVGIHGMENRAESTGEWAGYGEPQFNYTSDGRFMTLTEVAQSGQPPVSCRIQAFRIKNGERIGTWAQVLWKEFAGNSPMWNQKGIHMIVKCVKAAAIRELFPRVTKGLWTQEEIDSAAAIITEDGEAIDMSSQPLSQKPELSKADLDRINLCGSEAEIKTLYESNKPFYKNHTQVFIARKEALVELYAGLEEEISTIETTAALVEWIADFRKKIEEKQLPAAAAEKIQPLIDKAADTLQIAGV